MDVADHRETYITAHVDAYGLAGEFFDIASLNPALVTIHEVTSCADTAGTVHAAVISPVDKDPTSIAISIADAPDPTKHAFNEKTTYVVKFAAGAKATQDITPGGEVDLTTASAVKKPLCFLTDKFAPPPPPAM